MSSSLVKTSLALAAACALWAGSAQAADTFNLDLTGTVANGSTSFQIIGPTRFDQWVLSLDGLSEANAFDVVQGDTVNTTVTFDQLFTVPGSIDLTTFALILGGAFQGGDVGVNGTLEFYNGATLVASRGDGTGTTGQLANSVVFFPPDNGPLTFDSFRSSFTIDTLTGPARLNYALATYTLFSPSGAVPEPTTWAMMIVGLGGAGAILRRRRDRERGLAAFA